MAATRPPAGQGLVIGDDRPVSTAWGAYFDNLAARLAALEAKELTWRKLSTTGFSTTTALASFALPADYRKFRVDYVVVASVAGAAFLQLSTDGTTYKTGAAEYGYVASSSRIGSMVNFGGTSSFVPVSDTANAAGQVIAGAFEFDALTNYGTADAVTIAAGAVAGRWSGGFYPAFAGASLAVRVGIVGGSMSSGTLALSGNL